MIPRPTHSHVATKTNNQSTNTTNHDTNTISSDRTPTHVNDGEKKRGVRNYRNRRSEVAPVVVHNTMVRRSFWAFSVLINILI